MPAIPTHNENKSEKIGSFEINDDRVSEFVALHMLVYKKTFKTTLRWIPKNVRGMIRNLNAINSDEYTELYATSLAYYEYYSKGSRNSYKKTYRRLLSEIKEDE